MGTTEQVASENYNNFIRSLELLSKDAYSMLKSMSKSTKDKYKEIMSASDPEKAAKEEMDKSVEKCRHQLSLAVIGGVLDPDDEKELLKSLDGLSQYSDISDCCTRMSTIDMLTDKAKELNHKVIKRDVSFEEGKSIFADYTHDFKALSRVPDFVKGKTDLNIASLDEKIKLFDLQRDAKKLFSPTQAHTKVTVRSMKKGLDEMERIR